jgi:TonB family protein
MSLEALRRTAILLCCIAAIPNALAGQPAGGLGGNCVIVPDTAVVPTPEQVAERQALRLELDSIARAHGTTMPTGILYVDADSMRQGTVRFIESNLSPEAVEAATRRVGDYLTTRETGRPYKSLIRIDQDYQAPAPGRRNCGPRLLSVQLMVDLIQRVLRAYPAARTQAGPMTKRVMVQLLVNRTGSVAYVEVERPTGDQHIDPYVPAIAEQLRFAPAALDGVPYDVLIRLPLNFTF